MIPSLVLSLIITLHIRFATCAPSHQHALSHGKIVARQLEEDRNREDFWHFVSRPDIKAPRWRINVHDEKSVAPGYWFLAPYEDLNQEGHGSPWVGPYIYDRNGDLIWSGIPDFKRFNVFDFHVSQVDGQDMLTLLYPHDHQGYVLDNSYNTYRTIDVSDNGAVNMHEFNVVENGTRALVLSNNFGTPSEDASREIGFNNGVCAASFEGFQELTSQNSSSMFRWSAEHHISLKESTYREASIEEMCEGKDGNWDILHLNALDKFPDGDYLLSSRHTDTLYKISHQDGQIVWRLGGIQSDFHMGSAKFSRQHHARVRDQNDTHIIISLFDNARGTGPRELNHPSNSESRGLLLALRTHPLDERRVDILSQFSHPYGGFTDSRGSHDILPNGNHFICWTDNSLWSEHHADGRIIMEATFNLGANSYRIYKHPWVGQPTSPPDVYARGVSSRMGNGTSVQTAAYVSWNGATEVASWNLYKSDREGNVKELLGSARKQGFETAITYDGYASYVVVEARDRDGHPLGRSKVFETIPPENMFDPAVVKESQWVQQQSTQSSDNNSKNSRRSPVVAVLIGVELLITAFGLLYVLWRLRQSGMSWWPQKETEYAPLYVRGKEEAEWKGDGM